LIQPRHHFPAQLIHYVAVEDAPSEQSLESARVHLREAAVRTARASLALLALGIAGLLLFGFGLSVKALPVIGASMATLGIFLGGLFGVAWYRSRRVVSNLRNGPFSHVHAIGWTRPPDGCNYALFPEWTGVPGNPKWILRLPLRRPMYEADGWLCGSSEPSLMGASALIDEGGVLLGYGRIIGHKKGLRRWNRRNLRPNSFVTRPPKGIYPPG
jgi:hypothetical protein